MQNLNNPVIKAFIMTYRPIWNICILGVMYLVIGPIVNMFANVLPVINASKLAINWNFVMQNHQSQLHQGLAGFNPSIPGRFENRETVLNYFTEAISAENDIW